VCTSVPTDPAPRPVAFLVTELFRRKSSASRLEGHAQELRLAQRRHARLFREGARPAAQRDSDFALDYVKRKAKTPDARQPCLKALGIQMRRACGRCWMRLYHAYVGDRSISPPAPFAAERLEGALQRSSPSSRRGAPPAPARGAVRLVHNEAQGGCGALRRRAGYSKADPIAAEIIKRCTGEVLRRDRSMTSPKPIRPPREILADVGALFARFGRQKLLEV